MYETAFFGSENPPPDDPFVGMIRVMGVVAQELALVGVAASLAGFRFGQTLPIRPDRRILSDSRSSPATLPTSSKISDVGLDLPTGKGRTLLYHVVECTSCTVAALKPSDVPGPQNSEVFFVFEGKEPPTAWVGQLAKNQHMLLVASRDKLRILRPSFSRQWWLYQDGVLEHAARKVRDEPPR